MRSRGASGAYLALEARLKERGHEISVTKLERWCGWRTHGLVDRCIRRGAGRGTTSSFLDLDRAADQATAVHDALRPRDSLDLVALRLTASGRELNPSDIHDAFLAVFDNFEAGIRRDAKVNETDDLLERAHNAGWAAHRFFTRGPRAHLRRTAGLPSSSDAWTAAGSILLGQPVREKNVLEFFHASGIALLRPLISEQVADVLAHRIVEAAPQLSLSALRVAIEAKSGEEIIVALREAEAALQLLDGLLPGLLDTGSRGGARLGVSAICLLTTDRHSEELAKLVAA